MLLNYAKRSVIAGARDYYSFTCEMPILFIKCEIFICDWRHDRQLVLKCRKYILPHTFANYSYLIPFFFVCVSVNSVIVWFLFSLSLSRLAMINCWWLNASVSVDQWTGLFTLELCFDCFRYFGRMNVLGLTAILRLIKIGDVGCE